MHFSPVGGALQLPREPANLLMDLNIIAEVFVVVVIGGMGSIVGAFVAAVLIAELQAFGIVIFPEITLVVLFLVMAVVLVFKPWGLFGRPEAGGEGAAQGAGPVLKPAGLRERQIGLLVLGVLVALPMVAGDYALQVASEVLIFALFAASLQFLTGVGGMISFGHAAYLGLGAYGAALFVHYAGWPMEAALVVAPIVGGLGGLLLGWFCVRLSGVYLAMLTLAFAQITWSIAFQWYDFTGGDNGILGIWPSAWADNPAAFYGLTLVLCVAGMVFLRRVVFSPFGYALRAGRDSALRIEAIGQDVRTLRWLAFGIAGSVAGLAGGLYAFLKGSVFPDALSIPMSVDALVIMLLGGVMSLIGPWVGALAFVTLKIVLAGETDYWRFILGALIIVAVIAFPKGLAGIFRKGTS